MKGEFDRKRRRVKRRGNNWVQCLINPSTVKVLVAVLVGITKVVTAVYRLYSAFRD